MRTKPSLAICNSVVLITRMVLIGLIFLATLFPRESAAQMVNSYVNSDTAANNIDGTRLCTGTPLIRTFIVSDSFSVSDVDIGVIATHTWRGDMQMTLESPAGTRVQFVNGDATFAGSADNFNARIDDEGDDGVVNAANVDHDETLPPHQFDLTPDNSLSDFDGESSNGTWTLEICDIFPGADNGNYLRAELFLTEPPSLDTDKTSRVISDPVSGTTNPKAIPGAVVEYCVSISNPNTSDATAISMTDNLPANVTFSPGTMRSGNDCLSATTVEDDDNIGADESDPVGASISGNTVTVSRASLNSLQAFAVTFRVTID